MLLQQLFRSIVLSRRLVTMHVTRMLRTRCRVLRKLLLNIILKGNDLIHMMLVPCY